MNSNKLKIYVDNKFTKAPKNGNALAFTIAICFDDKDKLLLCFESKPTYLFIKKCFYALWKRYGIETIKNKIVISDRLTQGLIEIAGIEFLKETPLK